MPDAMSDVMPLIDCDIHPAPSKEFPIGNFVAPQFHEALRQGMGSDRNHGYANPFGVSRRDAHCSEPKQTATDLLDRYNIAYGILQPPGLRVSMAINIDIGTAMATAWNDWLVQTWLAGDERYLGSISLNMNDPAAAAKEVRRAGQHPRMVQITIPSAAAELYGHRSYFPIYEAAAELGLPVCLHAGTEGCFGSSTPIGRPTTYFEWHTGISLSYASHLISLVCEGVFEKFPKLKFVLCEGGFSWLAHVLWRMDKNFKALRAATPWLKRLPSEYVFDHVRFTSQPLEEPEKPEHLLQMFEILKAEKILMFATDFPHWDFDEPSRAFPKKMSDEMRKRIFYENAAELYGLPSLEETTAKMTANRKPALV